jgi:FAD/FMN-containing dehydrogenase
MYATPTLSLVPIATPRVHSAGDLCRAMLARPERPFGPDISGLDRVLCHDAERGLLEVQAGTPWRALAGLGCASFGPGSVGESVAANAAGPDGRPVLAHLRSFTMVTADGELRRINREQTPDLFALAVGGFGALGPFYSVTLELASLASAAACAVGAVRMALPQDDAPGPRFRVELLAPPESGAALIGQVRATLEERRCELTRLDACRALPETETFLRWARRDYVVLRIEYRSHATLGAHVAAAQLRSRLIDLALAAGGGFAPADLAHATRAQAEAGYPMLGAFLAEKRRYDPAERVLNAWYCGARRVWRSERCEVRWARA